MWILIALWGVSLIIFAISIFDRRLITTVFAGIIAILFSIALIKKTDAVHKVEMKKIIRGEKKNEKRRK
jgi:uncharacterized membrane protein YhaH (DUF805 family)